MADVSHRDSNGAQAFATDSLTGTGSPEGVVIADIGAVYRRRDGSTNTTLYVKEANSGLNTGWVALGASTGASASQLARIVALEAAVVVLQAADVTLDGRLDTAETDITALESDLADLDEYVNDHVVDTRIVTLEADVDTLDDSMLAAENAIDDLEAADVVIDGRLDAIEVLPRKYWMAFAAQTTTAGDTSSYLNPVGYSTTPASNNTFFQICPVTGTLVHVYYRCAVPHTTNTVEIQPRLAGVDTDIDFDVAAADDRHDAAVGPFAVTVGDSIGCRIRHNGATDVLWASVVLEFEY